MFPKAVFACHQSNAESKSLGVAVIISDAYKISFVSFLSQNKSQDRWPSIVMRITDRGNETALLDGVVCFFDQQVSHFTNPKLLCSVY